MAETIWSNAHSNSCNRYGCVDATHGPPITHGCGHDPSSLCMVCLSSDWSQHARCASCGDCLGIDARLVNVSVNDAP